MQIYLLDIHIFYTLVSAFLGFFLGVRDRLGKVSVVTLFFCLRNVKIKIFYKCSYTVFKKLGSLRCVAIFTDKIFGRNSQAI